MSVSRFAPTRAAHLKLVIELFPGLQSSEMRTIVTSMAEKRLRRIRMELEDQANAIRLPISPVGVPS
ncbi:hypothetical protein D3218_16010 [Aureimonas flava]|uniref:Uncharacterized protein n=1 Tax=Aureimonas flava TaxID=2320271 RepID=A0A3A1WFE3_9HYPH|nr:hypothetical protein D3218_16010 [Aureimonas flava]